VIAGHGEHLPFLNALLEIGKTLSFMQPTTVTAVQ
jgi:hypothetical protein